jgi:hypothetical protein
MSQCPYGALAQKTMHAVLKDLGEAVDFSQVFIVEKVGYGGYDSLHGPDEVRGDVLQLCAAGHYPEEYRYMDFVACMASDVHLVPGNWKACAKETGLDPDVIEACADGAEGMKLLAESADATETYGPSRRSGSTCAAASPQRSGRPSARPWRPPARAPPRSRSRP